MCSLLIKLIQIQYLHHHPPVYHQSVSSHSRRRSVSIISLRRVKRKLFEEETMDISEGIDFNWDDTNDQINTKDDAEGPENRMEDAGGSRDTQDVAGGPENHMEDAGGSRDTQDVAGGHREHRRQARVVRRVNRRPLWQWNRIFQGGPYTPRRINFTGDERILKPLPENAIAEDFFKIYIDEEIIDHIVRQTNLYAEGYIERERANLRPHSLCERVEAYR